MESVDEETAADLMWRGGSRGFFEVVVFVSFVVYLFVKLESIYFWHLTRPT